MGREWRCHSGTLSRKFGSDFVTDANDDIEPWTGEAMGGNTLEACSVRCPFGFAAILESPGGSHRYTCHVTCGMEPANDAVAKPITSSDEATRTFVVADHGFSVGDMVRVVGAGAVGGAAFYLVETVVAGSFTVTDVDGQTEPGGNNIVNSAGASGTVIEMRDQGAYGIHFMYGDAAVEGSLIQVHHEPGSGNGVRAWGYIQNILGLKDGTPHPIRISNGEWREQTAHGILGFLQPDTASVDAVFFNDAFIVNAFSIRFGSQLRANKMFLSPKIWKVRADCVLGYGDLTIDRRVRLQGRVVESGENNDVTMAVQIIASSATVPVLIPTWTKHAVITSVAAANLVQLPLASEENEGLKITLWVANNGFTLTVPPGSGDVLNHVGTEGLAALIPADTLLELFVANGGTPGRWIMRASDRFAAIRTPIVPA